MWNTLSVVMLSALAATGPHGVGRQFTYWQDESRMMGPSAKGPRELAVWIWYPTSARGGARGVPQRWSELRAEVNATRFGEAAARAFENLRVQAVENAPLLEGREKFPVLVFSPGFNWIPPEYSSLLEDLASHGYVVVGVAPTGFTGPVVLSDGTVVKNFYGPPDTAVGEEDLRFVRRQIESSPMRDRLDLDRVGVFGHSLGGAAAIAVSATEPGYRAAVNIDGDPMNAQPQARPKQPLMLISNEEPIAAHSEPELQGRIRSEKRRTNDWLGMSSEASYAVRVRLMGARHLDFTDMTLVERGLMTEQQRRYRFGPIAGVRALTVTREMVRSFFDHTLRGGPEPQFDGYSEVVVVSRRDARGTMGIHPSTIPDTKDTTKWKSSR